MADHRNHFRLDGTNPYQIRPRIILAKYVRYPSSSDDSLPLVDQPSYSTTFDVLPEHIKPPVYKQLQTLVIWCGLLSICVIYSLANNN